MTVETAGTPPPQPEVTSQMEEALQKTGQDMAAGMAALINDQMQESFQTHQQQMQWWKEEQQELLQQSMKEARKELEATLASRLQEMVSGLGDPAHGGQDGHSNLIDPSAAGPSQAEVLDKVENGLRVIQQRVDEGQRNMSNFQHKVNNKIDLFQKKLKALRRLLKKQGLEKYDRMIENLLESMNEQFQDIDGKIRTLEGASKPSDDTVGRLRQTLNDMNQRLDQGEASIGNFQSSMTYKVDDLREKITQLEENLQTLRTTPPREAEQPDEVINDTKSVVARTSEYGGTRTNDPPVTERRPSYADYRDTRGGLGPPNVPSKIPVSGESPSSARPPRWSSG